jgi:hypothetical protein
MGWNAKPTGRGGYFITPGSGQGQGSVAGLYAICIFTFVFCLWIIGWSKTWFIWVPISLWLVWRLVRAFMDWDFTLWDLIKRLWDHWDYQD